MRSIALRYWSWSINDLEQVVQLGAGDDAAAGLDRALFRRLADDERVQLLVVREVELFLAALDLVERRAGDEDVPLVDERPHLPVEERQEERADVRSVHVGVGHDEDAAVARASRCRTRPRRSRSPSPR